MPASSYPYASLKIAASLIPLVLHGGSGTGDENIAKACRMGINKVNVCTELLSCVYQKSSARICRWTRCLTSGPLPRM